jgi:hypothetical protein
MAKLGALPAQNIIAGAKGTLDYYVHWGIPCCRSWPRPPPKIPSPAKQAQWPIFADAVAQWNTLDPMVRTAYQTMAAGSTMSGRDIMIKMYINGKSILPY